MIDAGYCFVLWLLSFGLCLQKLSSGSERAPVFERYENCLRTYSLGGELMVLRLILGSIWLWIGL